MERVYCKNCKYYECLSGYMDYYEKCNSPYNNFKKTTYREIENYKKLPSEINQYNSCELYKIKEII